MERLLLVFFLVFISCGEIERTRYQIKENVSNGSSRLGYFYSHPELLDYYSNPREGQTGTEDKVNLNPIALNVDVMLEGMKLYRQNCERCHDEKGRGYGGDAIRIKIPLPQNLSFAGTSLIHKDAYLFWTISEGGAPIETPMPVFKDTLTQDQIWTIISYLKIL